jgi:hypothetical protein
MGGYRGWSNRDTWAMALNLDSDYDTYQACQAGARRVRAITDTPDDFHAELASALERLARAFNAALMLPDFDASTHESPDPGDNNGPDDINGVDWLEIAATYDYDEYK